MCGFFASLSRRDPIREDYTPSLNMIAHRGPDGMGTRLLDLIGGVNPGERGARAWLGHRRLSIIDPGPQANQPMAIANGRYQLIFNGEIYNYIELREQARMEGWSFHTDSDTEVLLAAWALWGEAALARFVGMFAFVLVDCERGEAWLARDPFGIKPLHIADTRDRLLVCSEMPPILATGAVPFDIDERQAVSFVRFGSSTDLDHTLVKGIRRLPPGTLARFDFSSGTLGEPRCFWSPKTDIRRISFTDAVDECRTRFLDNVRLHLRSDVPVGAALSGGLDSSAIACAVKHLEPDLRLNTFSYISTQSGQSEEKWVDIVNAHIGAIEHKVRPESTAFGDELDTLIMMQGEPFGSASIYAQLKVFESARAAGVPVTLDGQGADEMLAGYWPYVATHGAAQIRKGRVDRAARMILHGGDTWSTRARMTAQFGQALMPDGLLALYRRMIGRSVLPDFFNKSGLKDRGVTETDLAAEVLSQYTSLNAHLADTTVRTSLPTLLRIADRSSMAHSVESRVPFLTADFADFLLTLPPEYHVSARGDRKHVFREAMRGILPEPVRLRRDKIGFSADDGLWLRKNWGALEHLLPQVEADPIFDPREVRQFIAAFHRGAEGTAQQVWRIMIYALWRDRMQALAS